MRRSLMPLMPLLLLLLALFARPADAQVTVIRDVRVFTGDSVIDRASVVIQGDRIREVASGGVVPAGAMVVEGAGRTLLPGLIDAHTHTMQPLQAEASLIFGVTTLLDMFTPAPLAAGFREQQRSGHARARADVWSAGIAATAPGGHGTQFGQPIPTLSAASDVAQWVKDRVQEGSDWIKIIIDDGDVYGLRFATLDDSTVAALVRSAHAHQRRAVVHVGEIAAARSAVAAGADGLVHVWVDSIPDPGFLQTLALQRVFVVPTLSVMASLSLSPLRPQLSTDQALAPFLDALAVHQLALTYPPNARSRASFDVALESVGLLHRAGVPILAGSDAPNPGTGHGVTLHGELELLVRAGLTPLDALRAATSRPADAFGLREVGRIRPGARADLLLVDGNPTHDIAATRAIVGVWKEGVRVDRDAWRGRVAAARTTADAPLPPDALVADFDSARAEAYIGAGWSVTTDALMGGRSTATMNVVPGGAASTPGALEISGAIAESTPLAWAGAMFMTSARPMSPRDLSSARGIAFHARGDGRTYRVLVFSDSPAAPPRIREFVAGPEWREHSFSWGDFGIDGSRVLAVGFVGGQPAGEFCLLIDDVRIR